MATCCNCLGKLKGCTCDGQCACFCTCKKTYFTDDNGKDHPLFVEQDWMYVIENPDLIPEGQKELHRTKGGRGAVGQAIARDKLRKLPPNCS